MSKLIRIERSIAKYYIADEYIVSDENIDKISLDKLLLIINIDQVKIKS